MNELRTVTFRIIKDGYESALSDSWGLADALHRRYLEIVPNAPADEPLPFRANGLLAPVAQPVPDGYGYAESAILERIQDDESELDRMGEMVTDMQLAVTELTARVDALNQMQAATTARLMGIGDVKALAELVHNIDGRLHALEEWQRRMEGDGR